MNNQNLKDLVIASSRFHDFESGDIIHDADPVPCVEDRLTWDETFMAIAEVIARRSKDSYKRVGAVIVKNKIVLGVGYNGFPRNEFNDETRVFPLTKDKEDPFKNKNNFIVHAEMNAILNASMKVDGSTIYCTLFPCHECAKMIVQSGIKEVVYLDSWDEEKDTVKLSKYILDNCGVKFRKLR